MIPTFGLVGAACLVASALTDYTPLLGFGLVALGASALEGWKYWNRKKKWMDACRTLPWYGKKLRLRLRDGVLSQDKQVEGDPRFERAGAILETPNGYLVRYEASEATRPPGGAVSPTLASVYIPRAAANPPLSREALTRALGAVTGAGR
jgi:hypothetical protein